MTDDPNGTGGPAPDFMISPDDYDAMVRTVIGEAGGEPDIGKVAVAHNILNRVASGKYPNTVTGVVTQPGQYESVNTRGAQLAAIPTDSAQYQSAARAVSMAISGQAPDPTGNALNFYAPQLQSDLGRSAPAWAKGPSVQIGRHVFYNGSPGQPSPAASTSAISGAPGSGGSGPTGDSGDLSADDLDAMLSGRASGPTGGNGQGGSGGSAPPVAPAGGSGMTAATAASALISHVGQRLGASNGGAASRGPARATGGGGPAAPAGGLTEADLDSVLAGRASSNAGGEDLSADDLDAMLSGGGSGAGGGTPGALTIHGPGNAQPSTVTPSVGPFGGLDRGAFGKAAGVGSAAAAAKTADVVPYLPGASHTATPVPVPSTDGAGAALDAVEGTGTAAYNTGPAEDGLTPLQRLQGMPGLGFNMVREAGQGVPLLGATVNPLAAGLASALTGRSLDDTTATGNALTGQFEAAHPALTGTSRLAGGAATLGPLAEAAPWAFGLQKGAPLLARMLTGGSTNALLAAGDAMVRGEDPTSGGWVGNGLRYGLGFAAPAAGDIAGGLTDWTGNKLGAVYDRLANLATTRTASGVSGMTPDEVAILSRIVSNDGGAANLGEQVRTLGPEATIADVGPGAGTLATGYTSKPSAAGTAVENFSKARAAGTNARIQADVNSALGPAQNPTPVRQAIEDTASAVTAPYFARAYEAGAPWTPELDALSQRPAVRNALMEAGTAAENRGVPLPVTTLDAAGNPAAATAPMQAFEAGQRPAVTAALADALGVDPTAGPLAIGDRIAAQRSAAADPAYQAYRSMPATTSPELAELLSRPSGRAAVALAERKAADQGRSIYVPQPAPEALPAPTPSGSAEIPHPFDDMGQGPGTLGPAGAGFSSNGTTSLGGGAPQRPTGPAPTSLVSFLQRAGGVQDAGGDLRAAGLDRFPGLIRQGGMTLDRAREAAAEAGYLGGDTAAAMRNTTPNDLLDAIGSHPSYSVHDEAAVAARQAWADYQASHGGPTPHDLAAESVRSHLLENDVPAGSIDPDTLDLAAHFHARGMDPGEAWEAAATSDPFPGDLSPEPRGSSVAPAEPAAPPIRDITPEGLDYVHRALGDKVTAALRGSDPRPDDARIIGGLQDELRAAMESHPNPDVGAAYAAARRAYAGPSREIEALDLGRRAYGNTVTREQVGRDFAGLRTDGERQQYRQGLFSAAAEKLAQKGDTANFADALAGNQAFRDKLATVAASPEALDRFGGALDLARQRFTEATRPNPQALHAALDMLDAKVARGGDEGVTAARNALSDYLSRDTHFARGRELQGSYAGLTGALDDGTTALRSGPNAIHPEDFAERFAGRTGAGQAAERIAIRNQVDRALGQKVNDHVALRNTLQGDDGWNADKIRTAFGEDAGNALSHAVNRETALGTFDRGVLFNSNSAKKLVGAKMAEEEAPRAPRLPSITKLVDPSNILNELALKPAYRALLNSPVDPRNLSIAKALIAQGAPRDQVLEQLARLEARRAGIKDVVGGLARGAKVGGNLLLTAGAPQIGAAVASSDLGHEADRRVRGAGHALAPSYVDPPESDNTLMRAGRYGSGRATR